MPCVLVTSLDDQMSCTAAAAAVAQYVAHADDPLVTHLRQFGRGASCQEHLDRLGSGDDVLCYIVTTIIMFSMQDRA